MKNRVAIYQREATEMLQNIAQYPGLTEEQLCRFFPEKESTAKILLSHMLKEGRAYRADNGRYYINQEIQNGADDTLSRCIWVLLDFIEQVEYHTAGEFPVEVLCFANGQLRLPQKDAGKRLVVVDDAEQIDALDIPHTAGFCTVAADGTVSYYRKEAGI